MLSETTDTTRGTQKMIPHFSTYACVAGLAPAERVINLAMGGSAQNEPIPEQRSRPSLKARPFAAASWILRLSALLVRFL